MNANDTNLLEKGSYISFATKKRSGEWVSTPVWFAPDKGNYYLFSAGNAGKVKRLRNFSESRIAPCTMSGTVTGDWHDTRAFVLDDPADQAIALKALRRKYGLQMLTADFFSRLTGKMGRRAYIRIEP
ncbi:MAG: PPOX class F420-dependent oxidoreductase [Halioglobus sp.]|nr:PPOX class F420-dependent oxidoreductase [Halioglobus sp.]